MGRPAAPLAVLRTIVDVTGSSDDAFSGDDDAALADGTATPARSNELPLAQDPDQARSSDGTEDKDAETPSPSFPAALTPASSEGTEEATGEPVMGGRQQRWRPRTVVLVGAALFSVFLGGGSDSGLFTLTNGPVFDVEIVSSPAVRLDSDRGTFQFTTVAVQSMNVAEALAARVRGQILFRIDSDGDRDDGGVDAQMKGSKEAAIAAAAQILHAAGLHPEPDGYGLLVAEVLEGSPADNAGLRAGDLIVAVNDSAVAGFETLDAAVKSDEELKLTLTTSWEQRSVHVLPANGKIGVKIAVVATEPLDHLAIITEDVGGASAGLIFTLALLDALTPGDLTGGYHVAGTGTVDWFGRVGAVEGVALKLESARKAGAQLFFAPSGEGASAPDGVQVFEVSDVSEALAKLCELGSQPACTLVS